MDTPAPDYPHAKEPLTPFSLIGVDGNAFSIVGEVSKALRDAGREEAAKEMAHRAFGAGEYFRLLAVVQEYVEEPGGEELGEPDPDDDDEDSYGDPFGPEDDEEGEEEEPDDDPDEDDIYEG